MGVHVKEKVKGSGTWWIYVYRNGCKKTKCIGEKVEAERIARKIRAKIATNEFNLEPDSTPTFKRVAEDWLLTLTDLKESTIESYEFNLKKHIYPEFKSKNIGSIKRKHIKKLLSFLLKKLEPNTVALIRAPIRGVFQYAYDEEIIPADPTINLQIRGCGKKAAVDPLTYEEAIRLLDASKAFIGGWYYPHLLCLCRTGIRIGELQALKFKDIDYKNRQLCINRSYRNGVITLPKTGKKRRVDITPHMTETLKALERTQRKLSLKRGRAMSEYIFAGRNGKICHRETFRNGLKRCLALAKLKHIRLHDLRHTYATIRLLRGHNIGDVSYQLGHSSIKITFDIYTHWLPGKFKNEVDSLDEPSALNDPQATPISNSGDIS